MRAANGSGAAAASYGLALFWEHSPQDKVAIITGGAGGIGLASASKFVAAGAKVLLVDLDEAAQRRNRGQVKPIVEQMNIRVNTVNPSPIETPMMRSLEQGTRPGDAEAVHDAIAKTIPLRRYGEPSDVANLMCFPVGDEADFLTGGVYMVDGGRSAF